MKLRILFVTVLALSAFTPHALAGTNLILGVDDDTPRWMGPAGALTQVYRQLGLQSVRVTLQWQPGETALTPTDRTELDRATLATWGMRLVVAVDGPASQPPVDAVGRAQYCSYVSTVLRRSPRLNDVVIWTEPNSSNFWRPQAGAPAAYEALLASCWDALHAVRPHANVIAASAPHQNPAAWYGGIGAAYRASGRATPIFDTVGHNAYPDTSAEVPSARHRSNIDEGDYARFLTVLGKAFGGTAQPLPGQRGVSIWYMEDGFQSQVTDARHLYTGSETDRYALPEEIQASQLAAAMRLAYCQPFVGAFFNFELRDETLLSGWQSGVLRVDWSAKPSFYAYRDTASAIAHGTVACA